MEHNLDHSATIQAGLKGRCPKCGEGALFDGFLTIADQCQACGFDYSVNDVADGPAIFIIILASGLVIPPALVYQIKANPPILVTLLIFIPLITLVCIAMLRPFRGLMFAMQIKHDAKPGELDVGDTDTATDPQKTKSE